jgi:hypothetical protein
LFPLPLPAWKTLSTSDEVARRSTVDSNFDRFTARSVVELFSLCIEENSLAASASALPLLSSRLQSRNYCDLLLARSIEAFIQNTDSSEAKFDFTQEERRVIGDIFRFGIKLEDAASFEAQLSTSESKTKEEDLEALDPFLEDPDDITAHVASESSDSSEPIRARRSLICMSGRQSSILSYIVPSIFPDGVEEEEAIRRAATSFIDSKNELTSIDFLTLAEESDDDSTSTPDGDLKSLGGLVGDVLVQLLRSPKIDHPWKTMSSLTRLLLQNEKSAASSHDILARAVEQARAGDFDQIVPMGYEGDATERLVRFIVVEIGRCGFQINGLEAGLVVDLVLLLLQRLSDFPLPSYQHSVVTSGLALIGVIAGHNSDRASKLLSSIDQECFLVKSYNIAKSDSAASV